MAPGINRGPRDPDQGSDPDLEPKLVARRRAYQPWPAGTRIKPGPDGPREHGEECKWDRAAHR